MVPIAISAPSKYPPFRFDARSVTGDGIGSPTKVKSSPMEMLATSITSAETFCSDTATKSNNKAPGIKLIFDYAPYSICSYPRLTVTVKSR